jgi:hypothetical protein
MRMPGHMMKAKAITNERAINAKRHGESYDATRADTSSHRTILPLSIASSARSNSAHGGPRRGRGILHQCRVFRSTSGSSN